MRGIIGLHETKAHLKVVEGSEQMLATTIANLWNCLRQKAGIVIYIDG